LKVDEEIVFSTIATDPYRARGLVQFLSCDQDILIKIEAIAAA
jgi:hypothetical protein